MRRSLTGHLLPYTTFGQDCCPNTREHRKTTNFTLSQILKPCLLSTKDNHPNFCSTHIQPKVSLQMKNENQNKTCWGRKRERRQIVVKKNKNNNSIQHTRGWENIKFSFYSKYCVEFCFILLFMSFIFFLALKHIYAASFPPVSVQHEYSHNHYKLQMCTHTHTHTLLHHTQRSVS